MAIPLYIFNTLNNFVVALYCVCFAMAHKNSYFILLIYAYIFGKVTTKLTVQMIYVWLHECYSALWHCKCKSVVDWLGLSHDRSKGLFREPITSGVQWFKCGCLGAPAHTLYQLLSMLRKKSCHKLHFIRILDHESFLLNKTSVYLYWMLMVGVYCQVWADRVEGAWEHTLDHTGYGDLRNIMYLKTSIWVSIAKPYH